MFRDIKHRARRDLHNSMQVAALYIDPESGAATPCTVRVHYKPVEIGRPRARTQGYVDVEEVRPRIVFMLDQIPQPKKRAIVSIEPGEAYEVSHTEEPDGISIIAVCMQVTSPRVLTLPTPGSHSRSAVNNDVDMSARTDAEDFFVIKFSNVQPFDSEVFRPLLFSDGEFSYDTRAAASALHEFFSRDRFHPHAPDAKYFVRAQFDVKAATATGSVQLRVSAADADTIAAADTSVVKPDGTRTVRANFAFSLVSDPFFFGGGAKVLLKFQHATEIENLVFMVAIK